MVRLELTAIGASRPLWRQTDPLTARQAYCRPSEAIAAPGIACYVIKASVIGSQIKVKKKGTQIVTSQGHRYATVAPRQEAAPS